MSKTLRLSYKVIYFIILYISFIIDYMSFNRKAKSNKRFNIDWGDKYPCLYDKTSSTGFDSHYIYHTSWAARILNEINPVMHIDIGSSLYFIGIVSAFIPIEFYDYRPAALKLDNLFSKKANILKLPFGNNTIKSLSCMHVVEHIGLGRYGDELDPNGDLKAIDEIKRVLAVGGDLLFVVPVGEPKIKFNAHRIYGYEQIMDYFKGLELIGFSLVADDGLFINNAPIELANQQKYGCGCFWFKKLKVNL